MIFYWSSWLRVLPLLHATLRKLTLFSQDKARNGKRNRNAFLLDHNALKFELPLCQAEQFSLRNLLKSVLNYFNFVQQCLH